MALGSTYPGNTCCPEVVTPNAAPRTDIQPFLHQGFAFMKLSKARSTLPGILITARAQLSMFSTDSSGVAEESRVSILKINRISESTGPVARKFSFYM